MNCLDLFAGVGGLTLGMKAAGLNTVAAIEIDNSCAEIWEQNFPKIPLLHGDIHKYSAKDIKKLLKPGQEVDVICGGPPCQGFSLIGLRREDDPRSDLIFEFRRFVKELKPKYFIFENVPGILSAAGGEFYRELIKLFKKDGYNITEPVQIINAANFGTPQARNRVFILGTRKDLPNQLQYPEPKFRSPRDKKKLLDLPLAPSVWDAIHDLPEIDKFEHLVEGHEVKYSKKPRSDYAKMMRGEHSDFPVFGRPPKKWDNAICTNCRRTVHGEVLTKRFIETPQGETAPVSRLFKLKWDDVANTLRAGTPRERGAYSSPRPVHPEQPRVISVREGARLQGFPDWFAFHPTKWHGFRQVGNSVSPLVAYAVAQELIKADAKNNTSSTRLKKAS